jgi:hypothetical protein
MHAVLRFTVSIEAPSWEDVEDIELPAAPHEGDTIETRYGTCLVMRIEDVPNGSDRAGRIVCRLP